MKHLKETLSELKLHVGTQLSGLDCDEKIHALNEIREFLHCEISPFKNEPVDMVYWVKNDVVVANDYNPNSVAPPEMQLLERSIDADGYTQPIVSWPRDEVVEVVDGFHRHRVGKESKTVSQRVMGYLPVVKIKESQEDRNDRMASTIRHNRARGKHKVESMAEIVMELKRRNWSDKRIGKELGMDEDEVLRLTQIRGLAEMFQDRDFSEAWEHDGQASESEDGEELEWMKVDMSEKPSGWHDRTEQSSVLYSDDGQLGCVQKSRFNDEWFWYAYTVPMKEGRSETRDLAKLAVEECQK